MSLSEAEKRNLKFVGFFVLLSIVIGMAQIISIILAPNLLSAITIGQLVFSFSFGILIFSAIYDIYRNTRDKSENVKQLDFIYIITTLIFILYILIDVNPLLKSII